MAKFFALDPNRKMLSRSPSKILWIFIFFAFFGLIGETIQHAIAFGEWQHRAGFVWGPFSPIYGSAAVLMLLALEPLIKKPTILLFLIAAMVGGSLEYCTHWAMETFWGIVAWSYVDWPFNFNGRTDLTHACLWGLIGITWIRIGVPVCDKIFAKVNTEALSYKVISALLAIFVALNGFCTVAALLRANERTMDMPQNDFMDAVCDTYFTDDYLRDRFNNMGGLGLR